MADNFFTRKSLGGVPNFVWLAGGGLVLVLVLRGKSSGASASSTAAQQQQLAQQEALLQSEMAAASYQGYGGQSQPIYILPNTGNSSPGQNVSGVPSTTTPAAQGLLGSGFGVSNAGSTENQQTVGQYTYTQIASPAQLQALSQSGQQGSIYYEPVQGVFEPARGVHLAPGTPQYYRS